MEVPAKPLFPLLVPAVVISLTASPAGGEPGPPALPQTSALWGVACELWNPGTRRLHDLTNVGYMGGRCLFQTGLSESA